MQTTFVATVQQHFEFLIKDFGFSLLSTTESPRGDRWEGTVQYVSDVTYIELNCTRGESPSLWLGRIKDKEKHLLSIQVIYEYMNLSGEEKKTILSISEGREAARILSNKLLLNKTPETNDIEKRKELQIYIYARYLYEHCLPFLRGDFSRWLEIWEYHIDKLTVENDRAGRPNYVPIVVTDENGHFKVVSKQALFQKSLDYINDLRIEQGDLPDA